MDRLFALARHLSKHRPTSRVRQCSKNRIHTVYLHQKTIIAWLWISQEILQILPRYRQSLLLSGNARLHPLGREADYSAMWFCGSQTSMSALAFSANAE